MPSSPSRLLRCLFFALAALGALPAHAEGVSFQQVGRGPVLRGRVDGFDLVRDGAGWRGFFGVLGRGVQSGMSADLSLWTMDAGLRLAGDSISHPSVVDFAGARWMFVAVDATDGTSELHASKSTDGGVSWEHLGALSFGAREAMSVSAADTWLRADGRLGMLAVARRDGLSGLFAATSADGREWTLDERPLRRGTTEISVATDGHGGVVGLAVGAGSFGLVVSKDDGTTWSSGADPAFREPRGQSIRPPSGAVALAADGGTLHLLLATEMGLLQFRSADFAAALSGAIAAEPGVAADALAAPPAFSGRPPPRIEASARGIRPPGDGRPGEIGAFDRPRPPGQPGETGALDRPRLPGETGERVAPPVGKTPPPGQVGTELPADIPRTWIRAPSLDVRGDNLVAGDRLDAMGWRRMYYAARGGVGSHAWRWLVGWVVDAGLRVGRGGDEAESAGIPGHPSTILTDDGRIRMYYQLALPGVQGPPVGLYSAISRDGLAFEREGIRIATGPSTGFSGVGHGRAWRRRDGGVGLVFSGNRLGVQGPADLYLATSPDGLAFTARTTPLFVNGHDPSIFQLPDGRLLMAFRYLLEPLRVASSDDDGETWSAAAPIELINRDGSAYPMSGERTAEDVVWEVRDNGELLLWVNCADRGLCAFRPRLPDPGKAARAGG